MTDPTPTTVRYMTISEGLASLRAYYDHIPEMLRQQKQVLTKSEYISLWNKLRKQRQRVKEKIGDLLWQFYSTMKEERMKAKRDEFGAGC